MLQPIWHVLQYDLDLEHWRAFQRDGILLSLLAGTDSTKTEFRIHHLLTNAYADSTISYHGVNEIETNEVGHQIVNVDESNEMDTQVGSQTAYTRQYLDSLKKNELIELLSKHGMKKSGNKPQLVNRLFTAHGDDPERQSKVDQAVKQHKLAKFSSKSAHHAVYLQNFNMVDLINRKWYKQEFKYRVMHWRCKMFFGILKLGIINSHTLALEFRKSHYVHFREEISKHLKQK